VALFPDNYKDPEDQNYKTYAAELEVFIPENSSHPFWSPSYPEEYSWDMSNSNSTSPAPITSIKVQGWGYSSREAYWNVSQAVINIIAYLRSNSELKQLPFPTPTSFASSWADEEDSRQKELALSLHKLWSECPLFWPHEY